MSRIKRNNVPQALGVGFGVEVYACSNGSFIEKKKILSRNQVLYVQDGALLSVFVHSIACFGSVFIKFEPIRQPRLYTLQDKILDQVIETGKRLNIKAE